MGEGGGFTGDAAKPEAGGGIEIRSLQPAVVEAKRLSDLMLQIELAIVMRGEMARSQGGRFCGIQVAVKEVAGVHVPEILSAGPPSRTKRRSQ